MILGGVVISDGKTYLTWRDFEDGIQTNNPMQFTGLRDRNGREVYEGDILHIEAHELPFQVKFRGDIVSFEANEPHSNWWERLTPNKGYQYEVIGNIYENPELLN
jgi:uncharacterized phage protein (TIGR01671 family)